MSSSSFAPRVPNKEILKIHEELQQNLIEILNDSQDVSFNIDEGINDIRQLITFNKDDDHSKIYKVT
jgi:hypothetical protein